MEPEMNDNLADTTLSGWTVLFLANSYTRVPEASGGSKHFMQMAKYWQKRGQDILVMTSRTGVANCRIEDLYGPFRVLPLAGADRLGVVGMYLVRGFLANMSVPWRQGPLLLYGTSDLLPDVLPAFLASLVKRSSSLWVNCIFHLVPPPGERAGSSISNAISYLAQRASLVLIKALADMIVVDNMVLRDTLIGMGFQPQRIFVTCMGTGEADFHCETPEEYDACYLGRLHPSKGIGDLLDIWSLVNQDRPGSRLAVVGTGPLEGWLRDEVARRRLDGVVNVLGYLPREELERSLASSRLFVFPSHEEGFGISLVEGMSFGLPAVAYELPHYQEVFEDALITVPVGDVQGFAGEVLALLGDQRRQSEMGKRSLDIASRYTWAQVTEREIDAITGAVNAALMEREGVLTGQQGRPLCHKAQGEQQPLPRDRPPHDPTGGKGLEEAEDFPP